MPGPEIVTVDAGPVRLGARRWPGAGQRPVLCVHGLSSNARLWDEVAGLLADDGHPVLAVDLRGHGSSAGVADIGDDPTCTAAGDLAAACAALGWERPVVAGQSWGGNVVLQLAADRPDLVHGLVLVDGGWLHLGDRWGSLDDAWAVLAPPVWDGVPAARLRAQLVRAHPDWSAQAVDATLGNLEHRADGSVRPWLSRERHKEIVASMLAHRPRELYPLVKCPCTLLSAGRAGRSGTAGRAGRSGTAGPAGRSDTAGTAGRAGTEPAGEALAVLPAGSTLHLFPGGDHDLHAQQPNQVAAAIGGLA